MTDDEKPKRKRGFPDFSTVGRVGQSPEEMLKIARAMSRAGHVEPMKVHHVAPNPMPGLARDQLDAVHYTNEQIGKLVELTNANIDLARSSQRAAERSGRSSLIISLASIAIAVGSLAVAIVQVASAAQGTPVAP